MRFRALLFLLITSQWLWGQFEPGQTDTVPTVSNTEAKKDTAKKRHSPQRAVYLSMALPGAGQIYNRKYWKAPIAWGLLGVTIFFAVENHREYREFYDGFMEIRRRDQNDEPINTPDAPFGGQFTPQQLITLQNQRLQSRDGMIILAIVSYALNLVDAYVDGHLFEYDISDDLTINWEPVVQPTLIGLQRPSAGLRLSLTFDRRKHVISKRYF
jgi:hypothetical protein